jgi:integrase
VQNHVKFLREAYRLYGRAIPVWLKFKPRYGRFLSLNREELQRLLTAPLPPHSEELAIERDMFLFQLFTLLRDSDLRQLKLHHVSASKLPGVGPVHLLDFYQHKTSDAVRLSLPAPAAEIFQR